MYSVCMCSVHKGLTHNDDGHETGGDDDPVSIAVMSCLTNQDAIEDEVSQTKLEPSSCTREKVRIAVKQGEQQIKQWRHNLMVS